MQKPLLKIINISRIETTLAIYSYIPNFLTNVLQSKVKGVFILNKSQKLGFEKKVKHVKNLRVIFYPPSKKSFQRHINSAVSTVHFFRHDSKIEISKW